MLVNEVLICIQSRTLAARTPCMLSKQLEAIEACVSGRDLFVPYHPYDFSGCLEAEHVVHG